jgi:hypothetical protein
MINTDVDILQRGPVPALHRQSLESAWPLPAIEQAFVVAYALSLPKHSSVNYLCTLSFCCELSTLFHQTIRHISY